MKSSIVKRSIVIAGHKTYQPRRRLLEGVKANRSTAAIHTVGPGGVD
jgi:hypothetical protein